MTLPDLSHIPTDDPFDLYLGEVSHVSLLTQAEEIQLAQQIEAGKIAAKSLQNDLFKDDEEIQSLEWLVELGEMARSQLASANMRLVISIAKKYRGRGIDLPDLVQEGNIGLMIAVDKFDHHRGNRFSTHATWWIRQAIGRAVANHSRLIRVPVNLQSVLGKIHRLRRQYLQEAGREPTPQELGTALEMDVERVKTLLIASREPLRLQQTVSPQDDRQLEDMVEDRDAESPAELLATKLEVEKLRQVLAHELPAREARILQLYYGLNGNETHTFHQIAQQMGLSRERVRQLQKRAVANLADKSLTDSEAYI